MESPQADLTSIGAAIREALDGDPDLSENVRVARATLLERVASRSTERAKRGWAVQAVWRYRRMLALCTAGAVAGIAFWAWMRTPVSFRVIGGSGLAHVGDAVESQGTERVTMSFSEGSAVVLPSPARVRVLSLTPNGARVLLERGAIDVSVTHAKLRQTNWSFEAGSFQVQVTGTRFHLAWDPASQSIAVSASEGAVLISGPCLSAPRMVKAGDNLDASCMPQGMQGAATSEERGDRGVPIPGGLGMPEAGPSVSTTAPGKGLAWRELLAVGRLADGFHAAERADFDRVCRVATPRELLALADGARYAHRTARAAGALAVLRQRFPGSVEAATAAFALGRIAFERHTAYSEAVRWFGAYLDEAPSGPLMGDAVGRLMEARHRDGDHQGARADAERYLRRFPEGPYAQQAKGILAE